MKHPVIFGEVLFDCFPDSHAVMGGAPFNVAWHLAGFGFEPLMLTGVGKDARGDTIVQAMIDWGMDTRGVQINDFPTGQVSVQFENGEPQYDIVSDQAYDNIQLAGINQALADSTFSLLYHGSLIVRSDSNKKVLNDLISKRNLHTFVDVNLRAPWWDFASVRNMVANARWLKLNLHEFITLYAGDATSEAITLDSDYLRDMATDIVNNSTMELLIITMGEQGALCVTGDACEKGLPVISDSIVDTVGAGDAFSSIMIAGIMKNWSIHDTLQRALEFSSAICQNRGATSNDRNLYENFSRLWQL